MAGWQIGVVVGAGVLGLLVVLFAVIRAVRRRVVAKMVELVGERFGEGEVVRKELFASGFGQTSKGRGQMRGNGALVLTADELWFFLAVPQREMRVPLSAVSSIESRRSHLGKTIGRELLFVEWDEDGAKDSAAWWVPDLEGGWASCVGHARWTRTRLEVLREPNARGAHFLGEADM